MKKPILITITILIIILSSLSLSLVGCDFFTGGDSEQGTTLPDDPAMTIGQKNALSQAKTYLSVMPFSYLGLITQLEFEQYTFEDSEYAAKNCGADWNEQAAKKAAEYLALMSFSREGLIDQLEFDKFTHSQAVFGVEANGY